MTHTPTFRALRALSGGAPARYELLLVDEGRDTTVGPLREYAARSALACLGFAGVDIDAWIEGALAVGRSCVGIEQPPAQETSELTGSRGAAAPGCRYFGGYPDFRHCPSATRPK